MNCKQKLVKTRRFDEELAGGANSRRTNDAFSCFRKQERQLSFGRVNKSLYLAIRPKTLTAAFVPLVVSSALVAALGHTVSWAVVVYAGTASFLIQIATNLINDAIDFKKGADTAERTGPVRVTQSGLMSAREVLWWGFACLAGAALCGVPLLLKGGWPICVIGVTSLVMAYAYTAGPLPLAYLGLGDLFVVLFFGVIAVAGLVFLQTGQWLPEAIVAGLQVGFLATVLIAVNNARDIPGDRRANKKTLAARFGITFARLEVLFLFAATFLLNFFWLPHFGWWPQVFTVLALPAAGRTLKTLWLHEPSARYNQALATAAQAHLFFGVLLALGFCFSKILG